MPKPQLIIVALVAYILAAMAIWACSPDESVRVEPKLLQQGMDVGAGESFMLERPDGATAIVIEYEKDCLHCGEAFKVSEEINMNPDQHRFEFGGVVRYCPHCNEKNDFRLD